MTIPSTPDELTPEWLTEALRETETIKNSTVTSYDMEPDIAAGTGFLGRLARVTLRYDEPEPGAPTSLIAKFPTDTRENRAIADLFRCYEIETRFYEEIAGEAELRTPHCYYSARDADSTDFILLLEDLAPARVGDQVVGCSAGQAELAIRELAKFHASWWEHPRLAELDWLWSINHPVRVQAVQDSYQQAWRPFLENVGKLVPPDIKELGEEFGTKVMKILDRLSQPPVTISHGDYRLDNLFFATPAGGEPLAVVDWQVISRACGMFDVAYFMSGALPAAERRAMEMDLLHIYHGILIERGVEEYDFDQCFLDYRASTLCCWQYAVIILGTLDPTNERGLTLFTDFLERTISALTDLNAGELMPS